MNDSDIIESGKNLWTCYIDASGFSMYIVRFQKL